MNFLKCRECNKIYFEISRYEAEQELFDFNHFYNHLPPNQRKLYKRITIEFYEFCVCGEIHETAEEASADNLRSGEEIFPMISPQDYKKVSLL